MFDKGRDIVLFFTPEAAVGPHFAAQCVTARTLKERGYQVAMAHCTGTFARCPVMDMYQLPYDVTPEAKREACDVCIATFAAMVSSYGLHYVRLADFFGAEDEEEIASLLDKNEEGLFSLSYDSFALGTISAHDVILALKQYSFSDMTELQRRALRSYLQGALQSYIMLRNVADTLPVGRVVRFNDYSLLLAASFAATKKGIPVITTTLAPHKTADFQRFSLSTAPIWREAFYAAIRKWESWRDLALTAEQVSDVVDDMMARYSGHNSHTFSPPKTFTQQNQLEQFGLSPERKTLVAFTSSKDEVNAGMMLMSGVGLPSPDIRLTFPDQIAWLKDVVDYVEKSEHLQLIVRIHPREGGVKGNRNESQHLQELRNEFDHPLRHCRFVWPADPVSSYDLFEITDLALISWSTIGLELARLGIPVLAMNKGTSYPGDDFIEWAPDAAAYFGKLEELLTRKPSLETLAHAFRFYTCFNLGHALNLSDVIPSSGVTADFKGLPPFQLTRQAAAMEQVVIDGRDTLEITLERQRELQRPALAAEERTALLKQVKRLVHFLCTGSDISADLPLAINGRAEAGRSLTVDGPLVTYRQEDGSVIRKNSQLIGNLARLYAEAGTPASPTVSRIRRRSTACEPQGALEEAACALRSGDHCAAVDLYEQVAEDFPQAAMAAYLRLFDLYAALPNQDRYSLYVSRHFDFGIRQGDKVLDIGSGHLPFPFATHLADFAVEDGNYGRAGIPFRHVHGKPVYNCSVEEMPFADQEFDFVYCSHVLEHVDSPEKACRELMRVGKRGYIETPTRGKDLWLDTAKISNHRWSVELFNNTLIFSEYTPEDIEGLACGLLLDMHCNPQTDREKALSALINLKSHRMNTMLYWEGSFSYEVRRLSGSATPAATATTAATVEAVAPAAKAATAPQKPHSAPAPQAQPARSCVFLNTYYDGFLQSHYGKDQGLAAASYAEQLASLQREFFGDSDFYSGRLKEAGWNATDLIVNCDPLQRAWATEQGVALTGLRLVVEQIARLKPEVVYIQDMHFFPKEFLAAIRPLVRLIVGQIASPANNETPFGDYDIVVSSFPHFVEMFRKSGITSYYQPLAFDKRVLEQVKSYPHGARPVDCSFVGGISPMHQKGYELLEHLARHTPIRFWGYGAERLPTDSPIRARHNGEAWGKEMFTILASSKIAINRHIDVAQDNANNMRLFEATGCGALLITDYKENLEELFEIGKEVVAYRSPEECVALIDYYLAHPEEAEAIAKAGQARTLRDHSYAGRMAQTAELLERQIRYQDEAGRLPAVDLARISCGHTPISSAEITQEHTSAWRDGSIPASQRALVQHELAAMYKGQVATPFQVLAEAMRPITVPGSSVLEIGCASGYYFEILEYLLNRRIDYTGVDYSDAMIAMAKDYYPKGRFFAADGANLFFADRQFHTVISSCILLHVPNYRDHIAETARVAAEYIVCARTPICKARPTQHLKKLAYGVETVELIFNEEELLREFALNRFQLLRSIEYLADPASDGYQATYLFRRV